MHSQFWRFWTRRVTLEPRLSGVFDHGSGLSDCSCCGEEVDGTGKRPTEGHQGDWPIEVEKAKVGAGGGCI